MKAISNALQEWRAWMLPTKLAGRTVRNAVDVVDLWSRRSESVNLLPSEIKAEDILTYLTTNYPRHSTRSLTASFLAKFFDFCQAQGYAKQNPARLATGRLPDAPSEPPGDQECMSDAMAEQLMGMASGFWKVAIVFAYYGGLKFRNIVNLKWNSFERGDIVTVTDAGASTIFDIPMTPEMRSAIKAINRPEDQAADGYCFPREKRLYDSPSKRAALSVYFTRLCQGAGLKQGRHSDLRRLFLRREAAASRPAALAIDLYDFSSVKTCQTLYHSAFGGHAAK
jgi:integrase